MTCIKCQSEEIDCFTSCDLCHIGICKNCCDLVRKTRDEFNKVRKCDFCYRLCDECRENIYSSSLENRDYTLCSGCNFCESCKTGLKRNAGEFMSKINEHKRAGKNSENLCNYFKHYLSPKVAGECLHDPRCHCIEDCYENARLTHNLSDLELFETRFINGLIICCRNCAYQNKIKVVDLYRVF